MELLFIDSRERPWPLRILTAQRANGTLFPGFVRPHWRAQEPPLNSHPLSPILVASPEIESRRALTAIVNQKGWETVCAAGVSECREVIALRNISVVLCDRRLADGSYRDLLAALGSADGKVRVIVMSRLADWGEYREVLQHGGFELIPSPCRPSDVVWAITEARREENGRAPGVSSLEPTTFAEPSAPLWRMARTA